MQHRLALLAARITVVPAEAKSDAANLRQLRTALNILDVRQAGLGLSRRARVAIGHIPRPSCPDLQDPHGRPASRWLGGTARRHDRIYVAGVLGRGARSGAHGPRRRPHLRAAWPMPWCPRANFATRAHDAAVALSKRPAGSLAMTKRLMRDHQRIATQIAAEGQLFKERLKTAEAREAFAAFAENAGLPIFLGYLPNACGYLRTPTCWLPGRLMHLRLLSIIQQRRRRARLAASALR